MPLLACFRSASALAALAVTLGGCAATGEGAPESVEERTTSIGTDCFTISLARDFRYLDQSNLIVFAPASQPYHLELSSACIGMRGQFRIALRARTDQMCGFAGDAVVTDGPFAERCPVLRVRRLDEDQLATLIARFDEDPERESEVEVVIPPAEE